MFSFDKIKSELVELLRVSLGNDFYVFDSADANPLHAEIAIGPTAYIVFIIMDEHDHGERYVEWLKWQYEAENKGFKPLLFFYEDSGDIQKFAFSVVKLVLT